MSNKFQNIGKAHSVNFLLSLCKAVLSHRGPVFIRTASVPSGTTKETLCSDGLIGATVAALAGKTQIPGLPNKKRDQSRASYCIIVNKKQNKSHAKQFSACDFRLPPRYK